MLLSDRAPAWFLELCRAPKHHARTSDNPITELDTEQITTKAVEYLRTTAPAIEGNGGNDTTYKVAARLREIGTSEGLAFELMDKEYNPRCEPPWDPDELEKIVENAFSYATGDWGGMSGLAEFGPVEILERPKNRLYWLKFAEAAGKAYERAGASLIQGLIDALSMVIMYGASGSCKTFVMLDLAFHIAAGLDWHGRKTRKGLVAYIAAEGGRGILKRVAALKKKYEVEDVALAIIPCPINLLNSKPDLDALVALIREAEAYYGEACQMVVVDTLSRAISGGDENASTDMGGFVRNVDRLREQTKAALAIVHHSGKDAARGARGHSLLRAATDTEIEIADRTLRVTKQRDIDPIKDVAFALEAVDLGKDADGASLASCVVRIRSGNEHVTVPLSPAQEEFFGGFQTVAQLKAGKGGDWKQQEVTNLEWYTQYAKNQDPDNWECLYRTKVKSGHWRKLIRETVQCGKIEMIGENTFKLSDLANSGT
jgi:hypothetical protein